MARGTSMVTQAVVLGLVMTSSIVVGGVILRGFGWGVRKAIDALEDSGVLKKASLSTVQNVQQVAPATTAGTTATANAQQRVTLVP